MNSEVRTISGEIAFHAVVLLIAIAGMTFVTNCHIDSKFDSLEKMIVPEKTAEQLKIEELEKKLQKLIEKENNNG